MAPRVDIPATMHVFLCTKVIDFETIVYGLQVRGKDAVTNFPPSELDLEEEAAGQEQQRLTSQRKPLDAPAPGAAEKLWFKMPLLSRCLFAALHVLTRGDMCEAKMVPPDLFCAPLQAWLAKQAAPLQPRP